MSIEVQQHITMRRAAHHWLRLNAGSPLLKRHAAAAAAVPSERAILWWSVRFNFFEMLVRLPKKPPGDPDSDRERSKGDAPLRRLAQCSWFAWKCSKIFWWLLCIDSRAPTMCQDWQVQNIKFPLKMPLKLNFFWNWLVKKWLSENWQVQWNLLNLY